jgi:hypothetical protein
VPATPSVQIAEISTFSYREIACVGTAHFVALGVHRTEPLRGGQKRAPSRRPIPRLFFRACSTPSPLCASPCLGWVDVSPCRVWVDFLDCHYITVFSPLGWVSGFGSVTFNALSTRKASGQPPLTPRRSVRSPTPRVTKRIIESAAAHALVRNQTRGIPGTPYRSRNHAYEGHPGRHRGVRLAGIAVSALVSGFRSCRFPRTLRASLIIRAMLSAAFRQSSSRSEKRLVVNQALSCTKKPQN